MSGGLSFFGKSALAFGSALAALSNPANAQMVAVLGEVTAGPALRQLRRRFERDPEGAAMLSSLAPARFPADGDDSLSELAELPEGSLGNEYYKFMSQRNFSPEERLPVEFITDEKDRWIVQRNRDVHDLWHVLTDMPTTLLGEISLKWFEAAHTGLPMALFAAVGSPVKLNQQKKRLLARELTPWAIRAAASSRDLMTIKYEDHLHVDMDVLRKEWNIQTVKVSQPELLYGKKKWAEMVQNQKNE